MSLLLAELLAKAGLPAGCFNVVQGDKVAVDRLLEHPDVEAVSFVGSTPIAKYIYETGTANGKRVQALGGAKNHMLVLPDADLDTAADAAVSAGYGSAGERCMAISVVLAVETRRRRARRQDRRAHPVDQGRAGHRPGRRDGPADHRRAPRQGRAATSTGRPTPGRRSSSTGATACPTDGYFLKPTLLDGVTPDMKAYQDEIFGPVLSVTRVGSYDEGLALINANPYGNGTAIFTRDGGAARQFQWDVNVGMVGVNVPIPVPGQLLQLRRLEGQPLRRHPHVRPRGRQLLHPRQGRHAPLARPPHVVRRPRLPDHPLSSMDFGLVLQTTPPSARVVDLAKRAETYGFTHVWTFDSHILWQEPYVIYSQILDETRNVVVGPMVTNPATRDWTVTASMFATLNEMYGNRTVCGIGRGDSAVRVTNGKPTTIETLRQSVHVIRELANGRSVEYHGSTITFPWAARSELEVWVAGYGPRALALAGEVGDGFILQLADPQIVAWTIAAVREGARAGRAGTPTRSRSASPPRPTSATTSPTSATSAAGSAGWSATTSPTSSAATATPSDVPAALTEYIKGRQGYDYNQHGQAGNTHADFVPDEIVDRFCILGPVDEHVRRLEELADLGVDQFAIYLQHDGKDATLQAYGEHVIPALAATRLAKQ